MLSLTSFCACNPEDPEANLLVESWTMTRLKVSADSAWQTTPSRPAGNVVFKRERMMGTESHTPFNGGWCNDAKRYTLVQKTILFDYGKAGCIPLIDPKTPSEAKIRHLNRQLLVVDYNGYLLEFSRE